MSAYSHIKLKQKGQEYLKNNVTVVHIVVNPVKSDSYAETVAKSIGSAAFGSVDAILSEVNNDSVLTLGEKSGIDPTGVALVNDDLSVAYCSATEVILVVDATNRAIANETGDTLKIPVAKYTVTENTSV